MKNARTFLFVALLTIGCKPAAESQTIEPKQAPAQIPQTVSTARRTPVVVVAHNVAPSVVNIQTEATIRQRAVDPFFDPFGLFGGQTRSYTAQSLGSGFVWSADGIIVTNNHVIGRSAHPTVSLLDGWVAGAEIVGRDEDTDLAVLRISGSSLPWASLADSRRVRVRAHDVAAGTYRVRLAMVGTRAAAENGTTTSLRWRDLGCRRARNGVIEIAPPAVMEANTVWLYDVRRRHRCPRGAS